MRDLHQVSAVKRVCWIQTDNNKDLGEEYTNVYAHGLLCWYDSQLSYYTGFHAMTALVAFPVVEKQASYLQAHQ